MKLFPRYSEVVCRAWSETSKLMKSLPFEGILLIISGVAAYRLQTSGFVVWSTATAVFWFGFMALMFIFNLLFRAGPLLYDETKSEQDALRAPPMIELSPVEDLGKDAIIEVRNKGGDAEVEARATIKWFVHQWTERIPRHGYDVPWDGVEGPKALIREGGAANLRLGETGYSANRHGHVLKLLRASARGAPDLVAELEWYVDPFDAPLVGLEITISTHPKSPPIVRRFVVEAGDLGTVRMRDPSEAEARPFEEERAPIPRFDLLVPEQEGDRLELTVVNRGDPVEVRANGTVTAALLCEGNSCTAQPIKNISYVSWAHTQDVAIKMDQGERQNLYVGECIHVEGSPAPKMLRLASRTYRGDFSFTDYGVYPPSKRWRLEIQVELDPKAHFTYHRQWSFEIYTDEEGRAHIKKVGGPTLLDLKVD